MKHALYLYFNIMLMGCFAYLAWEILKEFLEVEPLATVLVSIFILVPFFIMVILHIQDTK